MEAAGRWGSRRVKGTQGFASTSRRWEGRRRKECIEAPVGQAPRDLVHLHSGRSVAVTVPSSQQKARIREVKCAPSHTAGLLAEAETHPLKLLTPESWPLAPQPEQEPHLDHRAKFIPYLPSPSLRLHLNRLTSAESRGLFSLTPAG